MNVQWALITVRPKPTAPTPQGALSAPALRGTEAMAGDAVVSVPLCRH